MSLVCFALLRMTNDALCGVSPYIAARLFVIVLVAITGARAARAEPPRVESAPPVVLDGTAVPAAVTQELSPTALTPIRRGTDPQAAPGERTRPSSLTSTLAMLGLVLGGAYVALNVVRRRQNAGAAQTRGIDLLTSCRLDGQTTLHLVHIGRRVLAVGSSAGGASTLAVIEDPEEVAQLIATSGDRALRDSSARRLFERRGAPAGHGAKTAAATAPLPAFFGDTKRPA